MAGDPRPSIFWEIHSGLPREGPGDDASTRKAFAMAPELPARPRILDVACGPGMQTLALARASDGAIIALDTHRPFLAEVARRAAAAGLAERIAIVNATMRAMPFADGRFDLIWCEGAIYVMGFREGLAAWRRLLTPAGCVAVTEPCWLAAEIPEVVKAHWAEYPAMTTIAACRRVIAACGYAHLGDFVLPDSAWWDDYYDPKARRLTMLREKYAHDAQALAAIERSERELDVHRAYSHLYGYVFFVMQRMDTSP
jgi:ubiquinone/menaquinone biosynthesis C-methylase UbiE